VRRIAEAIAVGFGYFLLLHVFELTGFYGRAERAWKRLAEDGTAAD